VSKVIIFSAEDDPADTLRPRLEKLKANLKDIMVYPKPDEFSKDFLPRVRQTISEIRPKLVIIDPLQCYLGSKDMNKATETRSILAPLAEIASEFECTFAIVRHLKKGFDKSTYKGMGSIDILGAVRAALLVGMDPNDKSQRAIFQIKSNLAPYGTPLGYKIVDGAFTWTGPSKLKISDIMAVDTVSTSRSKKSKIDIAKEFLQDFLDVPKRQPLIVKEAENNDITKRTLDRAKEKIGVVSKKIGDVWWWGMEDFQFHDCQQLGLVDLATLEPKTGVNLHSTEELS